MIPSAVLMGYARQPGKKDSLSSSSSSDVGLSPGHNPDADVDWEPKLEKVDFGVRKKWSGTLTHHGTSGANSQNSLSSS